MTLDLKHVLAGTSLLLAATSAASADDVASLAPGDGGRLISAVTVQGILNHEGALDQIGKRNDGTRVSGSRGFEQSAAYVSNLLKKAGYKVSEQTFPFAFFEELAPSTLARVSPSPKTFKVDVDFDTMDYSGSGSVSGRLVPTKDIVIPPGATPSTSNSGCEAGDFPAPPSASSVALIQRGTCDFAVKASNAAKAGYKAAIIFNEGQKQAPPAEDRTILLLGTLGAPADIPVLGTTFALGQQLYAQAKAGAVTVSLSTSTISENRTTKNVIADSSTGDPSRTVVVGAHLDSVTAGPGINDNGSGTSTNLEVALQYAKLKIVPRNRLRFAFWGAEEEGLLGSTYYVENLSKKQLAQIELNLNFDMLGSPNFARLVYDGDGSATPDAGPPGSDVIEETFQSFFERQGLPTDPTAFDGRSDYGPFIEAGIPAGGLFSGAEEIKTKRQAKIFGGTAGVALDPCYHQACDTIRNLSRTSLKQMSNAVAYSVYVFSQRGEPLGAAKTARASQAVAKGSLPYKGSRLQR